MKGWNVVLAGMLFVAAFAGAQTLQIDLSGVWVLDAAASDDFATAMGSRDTSQPMVRGSATGPANVGSGDGTIGRRGENSTGGAVLMSREAVGRTMQTLARAPDWISFDQDGSVVLLGDWEGNLAEVVTTDGRSAVIWFDGAEIEVEARWSDGTFQLERTRDGVTAVDTYERRIGTAQMAVTTTVAGGMGGEIRLNRVYNRHE
jgi:hypothetical protein